MDTLYSLDRNEKGNSDGQSLTISETSACTRTQRPASARYDYRSVGISHTPLTYDREFTYPLRPRYEIDNRTLRGIRRAKAKEAEADDDKGNDDDDTTTPRRPPVGEAEGAVVSLGADGDVVPEAKPTDGKETLEDFFDADGAALEAVDYDVSTDVDPRRRAKGKERRSIRQL